MESHYGIHEPMAIETSTVLPSPRMSISCVLGRRKRLTGRRKNA
jgi:hypothetical protein